MRIHLGKRLEVVAALVDSCDCAADIGTDHGKIPVFLVADGRTKRAIAGDKNIHPCNAARETAMRYGLTDFIEVRQGDGLKILRPGEVETIIIAGMGGELMSVILANDILVAKASRSLVLQPMNNIAEVRRFLMANGWAIKDEVLAKEKGHIYVALMAQRGKSESLDMVEAELGSVLLAKRPPLFAEYAEGILRRARTKAQGLKMSDRAEDGEEYRRITEFIADTERRLRE